MLILLCFLVTIITITNTAGSAARAPLSPKDREIQNVIDNPQAQRYILDRIRSTFFQTHHLFSLITDGELLKTRNDPRQQQYQQSKTQIMQIAQEQQYYPLYTLLSFEEIIRSKYQNKNSFQPVDIPQIYNFVPCIIQPGLQFLSAVPFTDALFTIIQSSKVATTPLDNEHELLDTIERNLKETVFENDAQKIFKKVRGNIDSCTENDAESFIKLVATYFRLQIVILDARETNNRNYPHELIDRATLRDEQQLRKSQITGTVYLVYTGGRGGYSGNVPLYRPVVPVNERLTKYPLKQSCFGKTVVEQLRDEKLQKLQQKTGTSTPLPPGIVKVNPSVQALQQKRRQSKSSGKSESADSKKSSKSDKKASKKSKKPRSKTPKQKGIFKDQNMWIIIVVAGVAVFCLVAICAGLCLAHKSRS